MALLCHCNVVSERCVEEAVALGATSLDEVEAICGAGSGCGGCLPALEAMLERGIPEDDDAAAA
jgi:nitrite reductase (NADH) large subunit